MLLTTFKHRLLKKRLSNNAKVVANNAAFHFGLFHDKSQKIEVKVTGAVLEK